MRVKSLLTVGLSLAVLTGVVSVADSFALDAPRADVISILNKKLAQPDSNKDGRHGMRVDVVGTIAAEGPAYLYTKPISH